MKLIIQIPCYNEEKTLPVTVNDLPKRIGGIDKIEILVINDGSKDDTAETARRLGVHHILNFKAHRGLARAFSAGLDKGLELGADIIVNTDGDNQYRGSDIPKLIEPILNKKADMVIGSRDISKIKHFSLLKKILQKLGSYVVRKLSKTDVPDTTSGFRAYSREAAMRLHVFSSYTYTVETIIQAGLKEIAVASVNISTNEKLRKSRLIKSIPSYIKKCVSIMLRAYLMYEPLKSFIKISLVPIILSFILVARFLIDHFTRPNGGHIQSLIIAAVGLVVGAIIIMIGLVGDIISANRKLSEEILYRIKKSSYDRDKSDK